MNEEKVSIPKESKQSDGHHVLSKRNLEKNRFLYCPLLSPFPFEFKAYFSLSSYPHRLNVQAKAMEREQGHREKHLHVFVSTFPQLTNATMKEFLSNIDGLRYFRIISSSGIKIIYFQDSQHNILYNSASFNSSQLLSAKHFYSFQNKFQLPQFIAAYFIAFISIFSLALRFHHRDYIAIPMFSRAKQLLDKFQTILLPGG